MNQEASVVVPSILIIIVTWNKKDYVIDLLNSLANLNYPIEKLDIVVVDNASTDGTVAALKAQFKEIRLLCNGENLGGTGGFNTGLAWAFEQAEQKYDYLWLLDNDVQVHKNALKELVTILQQHEDIAIAGSTMMQLDFPHTVNEMGAFVDRGMGTLLFNRHLQDIEQWKGTPLAELMAQDIDLSQQLSHCQPWMDVDYVAAASLLIRAPIAKKAGLWDDFFIHYDDVEWCLRIEKMGHRIAVSARSIIWHLSAFAKVPSWILYYDNRNILYLLEKHGVAESITMAKKFILKKSLYYGLLGKNDLSRLHIEALEDYQQRVQGKKELQLNDDYGSLSDIEEILLKPEIKHILIPWTVDLQACNLQSLFVRIMKQRPELKIDYIIPPAHVKKALVQQLPGARPLALPGFLLLRYFKFIKLYNNYDLLLQSDYKVILPLSLSSKKILYLNYEGISLRNRPSLNHLLKLSKKLAKLWFK